MSLLIYTGERKAMQLDYRAFSELLASTMAVRQLDHQEVADLANQLGKDSEFGEEILEKHISYMERGCPQGGHAYPARIALVAKALQLEVPTAGLKNGSSVALVPAKQQMEAAVPKVNGIIETHVGSVELSAVEAAYNAFATLPDKSRARALYYLGLLLEDMMPPSAEERS